MNLTLDEKMKLVTGVGMWHTNSLNGKIPVLHLSDGPHGLRKADEGATNNNSYLSTCFPTASAVAAAWNPSLARKMGEGIAHEAFNEDVSILLGPGINMKRSPLCGRNFEYYSEDPFLAAQLGKEFVKAVEENGVGTSLKHYCVNSQETLRMTSNSMVDDRALREIYIRAFEEVVKETKPATIMASYNRINGFYATENTTLLTDILRKEWGYQGVVVSDWGACLRLPEAVKAGMDLEMPDSRGVHYKNLKKAYKNGQITEEEITLAANRVLHMVEKYAVENRNRKEKYDASDNHSRAIAIEEEAAVLLENDGVLPLKPQKVFMIGGLAKYVRYQGGGSSHIHTDKVVDAIQAFTKEGYQVEYLEGYSTVTREINPELESMAVEACGKDDTVLFFGGLPDFAEGEGYDRTTLEIPKNQLELLDKLYAKNKNIIFISFSGAPILFPFKDKCRAILHMYLGGEGVMEAAAHLISGRVNPSGKLAETFPLSISDTPANGNYATGSKDIAYKESMFIGYRYYDTFDVPVLYPFGYGKSYTSFSYGKLKMPKSYTNGKLEVTFTLKNTGAVSGKEVCQLYVSPKDGKYIHPVKTLQGFQKVELNPKETKEVTITLSERSFQIYDPKLGWIVPEGNYDILIGSSSKAIELAGTILVKGVEYTKDDTKDYKEYFDKEKKLHAISDEIWMKLYGKEVSHLDQIGKGSFDIDNSLVEVAPYSKKASLLLNFAKKHIYKEFKDKPKDDPEVMMMIETLTSGTLDCISAQGGIPFRIIESILLAANGHHFKSFLKLIFG